METKSRIIFWISALCFCVAIGILGALLTGCAQVDEPKIAEGYHNAKLNYDPTVYTIKGEVVGDINSVVRQSAPAYGSVSGYSNGGFGYVGGSFVGPQISGKNFVRLLVRPSDCSWLSAGQS